MKVGVVGCGAVGSFYGAKLAHAGAQVHFLLRSDYDTVQREGVLIRSPQGDFRVHPACARTPEEIGACDLVLVALKTTANGEFARLLPPLVGPETVVLTLQNGLGNEEQLARFFSPEQILGGLCFVCLNRLQPGLIHHIAHGLVVIGEFQRPPAARTHAIADQFRQAGVPCNVAENLAQAHWEKLTWNIPFNGLGVASAAGFQAVLNGEVPPGTKLGECLTTDKLLGNAPWLQVVVELMFEVIAAARGLGLEVSERVAEQQIARTRTMGAYRASTLLDFERRLPLELESLFLEPLRQAQAAGVSVPRLEALCRVLCHLDASGR